MAIVETEITRKQVGDAAEYLIAGLLGLSGVPTTKMLDNQPGFDLISLPRDGRKPQRVSVKCRSKSNAYAGAPYLPSDKFDWLAFVYLLRDGGYRCWLIPRKVCDAKFNRWNVKGELRMNCHANRIIREFARFENNFTLVSNPPKLTGKRSDGKDARRQA
jgi:hypothetical protein